MTRPDPQEAEKHLRDPLNVRTSNEMNDTFEIRLDDPEPDEDGLARGVIRIGDFRETFGIDLGEWRVPQYQAQWKAALLSLVGGHSPVALMTSMWHPDVVANRFAWILYREGDEIYVHQAVFLPDAKWQVDGKGDLVRYEPRTTTTDDGHPISE